MKWDMVKCHGEAPCFKISKIIAQRLIYVNYIYLFNNVLFLRCKFFSV